MISIASEKLAASFATLLNKIDDHCRTLSKIQQPFGLCIVTPKSPYILLPTKEIREELEKRAKEYFKAKELEYIYFRYWTPPLMREETTSKEGSADDYHLTLQVPQFDKKWQQTVIARNLIYCPLDLEQYEYLDWFELQEEAIRLAPIIHQTVKELEIMAKIERALRLPAAPIFEKFIYEYGLADSHQPISTEDCKKWKKKEIKWKYRYKFILPFIKSAKTVHDLYIIARQNAVSSRNPLIKSLFWKLVEDIENNLIVLTQLPEEIKNQLLVKLRGVKKRATKGKYVAKNRPAISVSDIECGQMLHVMICDYLNTKKYILAEAIFFVWIAQHGAFSDHLLTVKGILSISMNDINIEEMTIKVQTKEVYLTDGLNDMLSNWIGSVDRNDCRKLFQNITNDSLEDIITKYSKELYGNEGRLLPRDFLEKVHVVPGVRMPLDLRRKIIEQEKLVKDSPYRIKSEKIKKDLEVFYKNKSTIKSSPNY